MLKLVVVLAVTVGAFAGSGCFFQEEYACTSKNSVRCGDDWCSGDCAVELKKACDEKVLFKTTCELKDFCKAVEIPCGHNGDDPDGLNCAFDQECITTKKCKLIRASKVRSNYYGSLKKMGNGFVEICEDKFTCGAVDPWALDAEAITVVCTKEYKVVDDMDCATLFTDKSIWGAGLITEEKFFKMNSGFSCDKKLVGKLVCVEADATIKGETCSDGTTCDPGFECASKEECSNVAVTSPVCAKKPVFTCLSTPGSATLCGNKVCSGNQKCEIISKKVCPVVLPATGAVGGTVFVPGSGPVVVPGTNPVVIPGTNPSTAPVVVPGTIPGSAPIVIPGTNPVVIPGTTPGAGTPGVVTPQAAPLVVNGQVVPAISSVSSSLADDLGTVVGVDVVDNAGLYGYAGGSASTQDSFSVGYSLADNRNVFVASDSATTAASGESAVTQADGVSNVIARDQAFIVAEGTSDSQGVAGLTNSNTFAQSDFGIGSATAAALNTVDENFSAANSFADPTTAESITDTATLPGTVGEANAGADVRGNVTPP